VSPLGVSSRHPFPFLSSVCRELIFVMDSIMETDLIGLHQYSRTINAWSRSQCKIVHSEQHVCIRQGQSLMYVVSGKDRVSCMWYQVRTECYVCVYQVRTECHVCVYQVRTECHVCGIRSGQSVMYVCIR